MSTSTKEDIEYKTATEVAKYFRVGPATIREWVSRGYIPKTAYLKVGNTHRFILPNVIEALHGHTTVAPEPETTKPDEQNTKQLEFNFDEANNEGDADYE